MRPTVAHFQKYLLPPPRTFYERELGGRLSRPDRKGRARTNCPFHKGTNRTAFSVNLNSGAFHCFNCGASGRDMIDFVQLRYNLSFKEAAQRLNCWDECPSSESVARCKAQAAERVRLRIIENELNAKKHAERMAARDEIYVNARLYREAAARLDELHNGAVPATANEKEVCWWVMALALDDLRDCEFHYMVASGLEYTDAN